MVFFLCIFLKHRLALKEWADPPKKSKIKWLVHWSFGWPELPLWCHTGTMGTSAVFHFLHVHNSLFCRFNDKATTLKICNIPPPAESSHQTLLLSLSLPKALFPSLTDSLAVPTAAFPLRPFTGLRHQTRLAAAKLGLPPDPPPPPTLPRCGCFVIAPRLEEQQLGSPRWLTEPV